ncbi:MAG: hypothetical protein R3F60_04780 [bacterium]
MPLLLARMAPPEAERVPFDPALVAADEPVEPVPTGGGPAAFLRALAAALLPPGPAALAYLGRYLARLGSDRADVNAINCSSPWVCCSHRSPASYVARHRPRHRRVRWHPPVPVTPASWA